MRKVTEVLRIGVIPFLFHKPECTADGRLSTFSSAHLDLALSQNPQKRILTT